MEEFTAKYADQIAGSLCGFDRLVFRGTIRKICYPFGMSGYLFAKQVRMTEFGAHVEAVSTRVKEAALRCVREAGRQVRHLTSAKADKEAIAREMARSEKITDGPVCALTSVEPCLGFDVYRNRESKTLDLVQRPRKCLFVYQYWNDARLGWLNARIQTWFPFSIQICMNGREWLGRQLEAAGIGQRRADNCFPWVADWGRAQELMNAQMQTDWPKVLDRIAHRLNPIHDEIFGNFPAPYYWSVYQSEWATDVVFRHREDLQRLFPLFVRHAITTYHSPDVLRFLGKKLSASGEIHGRVAAEVTSDMKRRQEGVRVKHRHHGNSVKLYDKAYTPVGSVLRTELTLNETTDFKVYRRPEGNSNAPKQWLRMRKGIADLHRRAEVSQQANERYLNALAHLDTSTRLSELTAPVQTAVTFHGRRARALHPFDPADRLLLEAISRGEFLINGLRNKDLQPILYPKAAQSELERRRHSSAISRKLRLLRAHHLIRKVARSHRYHVTSLGRAIASAVLAVSQVPANILTAKAA